MMKKSVTKIANIIFACRRGFRRCLKTVLILFTGTSANILVIVLVLFPAAVSLKAEDMNILYPEFVSYNPGAKEIEFEIHAHVFDRKEDSKSRKFFIKQLGKKMKLSEKQADEAIFKERVGWFLIDNHRWKKLQIKIGDKDFTLNKTHSNGHSFTQIKLNKEDIKKEYLDLGYIPLAMQDSSKIDGRIYLIKEKEICVVSDIDDTIKISDVRNKQKLLENSFMLPFVSVPGMAKFYSDLKKKNSAHFFYVSASPWQLYTILSEYFTKESFPEGIYRMKQFRLKDTDAFNLFTSPKKYKYQTIEALFKKLPDNQFILIGDSGEKDPESYAELARNYPDQVKKILIRRAYKEDGEERFKGVFDGIEKEKWFVFDKPEEIKL